MLLRTVKELFSAQGGKEASSRGRHVRGGKVGKTATFDTDKICKCSFFNNKNTAQCAVQKEKGIF